MAFYKRTNVSMSSEDVEFIDGDMIKTAAFKLPDGIVYDPEFLYMIVKAVSDGEVWGANKNSDWFPKDELKSHYKTFLSAHVFKNHENKDAAKAIGDVLDAWRDDGMGCVKLLLRVDNGTAPSIVRAFKKGYMTDVSMGCKVDHSICSICGNLAKTPREYCDHVKFERGKIYPDGRKVYEINIKPSFHDISVVLNGAEKTAKVTQIYVVEDNSLRKVASDNSFRDSFLESDEKPKQEYSFNHSNQEVILKTAGELFRQSNENNMSKRAYTDKVAEIKKRMEGKIMGLALEDCDSDIIDSSDNFRNVLRYICEEYMDDNKSKQLGLQLKVVADSHKVPKEVVFSQFLKTITSAGCELSPKEFQIVVETLFDLGECDCDYPTYKHTDEKENNVNSIFSQMSGGAPSIKDIIAPAIAAIKSNPEQVDRDIDSPIRGMIVIKSLRKPYDLIKESKYIGDSIKVACFNFINERSLYSPGLIKKASNDFDNRGHFTTAQNTARDDIMNTLYMTYQNDRCLDLGSSSFIKEASEVSNIFMEKVAIGYGKATAWTLGLPVTFGYSKLQKSRIENGENVSSLNKAIAENPGTAYLIQGIFGPKISKGIKSGGKKIKDGISNTHANIADKSSKFRKQAEFVLTDDMDKIASETINIPYNSLKVDELLLNKYNKNEIGILKLASLLSAEGDEASASHILEKKGFDVSEVDSYIGTTVSAGKEIIKSTLEKEASTLASFNSSKIPDGMDYLRTVLYTFKTQSDKEN